MVNYENHKEENKNDEKEDLKIEIFNCCRENLISLLKYFVEQKGANLKRKNQFLILASRNGHKDIVSFLLKKITLISIKQIMNMERLLLCGHL
jgi:hypothetical protein